MPLRELERLTNAETLVVYRRRLGLTQKGAAKHFGVCHDMYSRWERGLDPRAKRQKVPNLKDYEVCHLYRRRSGMTQKAAAAQMGCCRRWYNLMERGLAPVGDLIDNWEV